MEEVSRAELMSTNSIVTEAGEESIELGDTLIARPGDHDPELSLVGRRAFTGREGGDRVIVRARPIHPPADLRRSTARQGDQRAARRFRITRVADHDRD